MSAGSGFFHFFTLTQSKANAVEIKRIHTSQGLQSELTALFEAQADEFLDQHLERIPFDSCYNADESEICIIQDYGISDSILTASQHPNQCESVILDKANPPTIKAIFASKHDHHAGSVTVYFQYFNKTQLLGKRFAILHSQNTFQKMNDPGLILDSKLSAAFVQGNLLFRSYSIVNRFLDIKEYFNEATNEEIHQIITHQVFLTEGETEIVGMADSWMRRRFAALNASGILDQITPRRTANRAGKYGIEVQVRKKNGKDAIVFPSDKKEAKRLLAFLNEGYYQGELTDRLYQTNSQRILPNNQ